MRDSSGATVDLNDSFLASTVAMGSMTGTAFVTLPEVEVDGKRVPARTIELELVETSGRATCVQ